MLLKGSDFKGASEAQWQQKLLGKVANNFVEGVAAAMAEVRACVWGEAYQVQTQRKLTSPDITWTCSTTIHDSTNNPLFKCRHWDHRRTCNWEHNTA
jgi:hypothetical protein